MSQHRWILSTAAGMGIAGVAVTTGLAVMASRFVEELSRPHVFMDSNKFVWKLPEPEAEPPDHYQRALLIRTRDGKLLQGEFWSQGRPAPTIILCHGYRVSGTMLRPVGTLEYSQGYNILLFDFRGHGNSESANTSGGNAEVQDLEAAIEAARQQPETLPGKIILHGFSMGAAIALLTPPHPDVAAIIADSPYAHLDTILRSFVRWQLLEASNSWSPALRRLKVGFSVLSWITVEVGKPIFRLRFGHRLIAHPARSMKRWQGNLRKTRDFHIPPVLLIHGEEDSFISIKHAHLIAEQARKYDIPLETYYAKGSNHCAAYGDYPQQYIETVQRFIAKSLGS